MISIRLGNVGSGKTLCAVREIVLNESHRLTFANIRIKTNNCTLLTKDMIIAKEVIGEKQKRGGAVETLFREKVNMDFWKKIKEPINVVIDEAHMLMNARTFMKNKAIMDWVSLIRRVLGQDSSGFGTLVLISQLHNKIDINARDMATNIRWHTCHYLKTCSQCSFTWAESSEHPEPVWSCQSCGHYKIKKHSHKIEVWHFASMQLYEAWKFMGMKTAHKHYIVDDVEQYFPLYDTLSWENFFTDD